MKLLSFFTILYLSPGCLSQCVNCSPQPTYQYVLNVPTNYVQVPNGVSSSTLNRSPCCVPTSNVQTIQSARAFTNGAQGSQVIMYYNGQRIVSGNSQQQQQGSGFNQNQVNNYQNPGPIPAPGYPTGNQNQNQSQQGNFADSSTGVPSDFNGGVLVGDAVEGGMGQPQQTVGGNVENQGQYQNSNQNINVGTAVNNQGQVNYGQSTAPVPNINTGGVVADQNSYQNQNQQYGNNPYDNQNSQGSTLSPSGAEVGYQPFVPYGGTNYNNNGYNDFGNQQGYNQQEQQNQYQQNQNDQNVIYPSGGVATGGAIVGGSSSYNSPNSGYVNSQAQPQTYPTQIVTGGAVNSQNVQKQPDANTQYQDQTNAQSGNTYSQTNQQAAGQQNGAQGGYIGQQNFGTTQGMTGGSTNVPTGQNGYSTVSGNQQQGVTNAPQGQFQQSSSNGQYAGSAIVGDSSSSNGNQNQFMGSTSPSYQQGGQQQTTTTPYGQQGYTNGPQGFTDSTLTPDQLTDSSVQDYNIIQSATQQTQQPFEQTTHLPSSSYQTLVPTITPTSTLSPYHAIYPAQSMGGESSTTLGQTEPTTVSSNRDEFGTSNQSLNDAPESQLSSTQSSHFVPVPIPLPVQTNENTGNLSLETSTASSQNDNNFESTAQVTGYTQQSTSAPYLIGGGVQGQSSTNSYQSTTPTTSYNVNGATTGGQQQSSNGFQSTTSMPITNENQPGFISSSTLNPNMPQAQYPSQQEILASTGQTTIAGGASGVSTQAPQYPSQQELGAQASSTQQTPSPQFPAQQDLGAATSNAFTNSNVDNNMQQQTTVSPQFPSQQELLQRDQQNSGASGTSNTNGFTPQYGDMNTQYGHYASSTVKASSNPQFDQPTADQQQPENSAASQCSVLILAMLIILL